MEKVHKVKYLSYTGYKKFRNCPESYWREYVLRERMRDEEQRNVFKGNCLHNLLEAYVLTKENRPDWIRENSLHFWDLGKAGLRSGQTLTWKSKADEKKNKEIYTQWADEMARLLTINKFDVTKTIPEFKADVQTELGGVKFKMAGRIDILTETARGDLAVLDLKASANKAIKDFDQVVWYSVATELKTGQPVDFAGYILPAFKEICIYRIPQKAKEGLKKRVGEALQAIESGHKKPDPDSGDCFWCPVKHACSLFGGATPRESGVVSLGSGEETSIDDLL